ncbi:MAG: spore cortex biosynthesis protein YabQ [Clostridia bacterium]|nr:spore cortex biosynthesis protein YabQ [Clostridia bacterium]
MGISVAHQTVVFLWSILLGAAIAFFYDFFRVIRKRLRHLDFAVMIEDVIFWLVACASIFVFVYNTNSGELRAFLAIGAIMGAFLYFAALSRPVSAVMGAVFMILEKIIKVLLRPFMIICRLFIKRIKKREKKSRNFLIKLKKVFKFKLKSVRMNLGICKK